jgi:hypothetical protein
MRLTIVHGIFLNTPHIQYECWEYPEILCGILSIPQNIIMDLNNIMIIEWYESWYEKNKRTPKHILPPFQNKNYVWT